jgi:hypothetical protein
MLVMDHTLDVGRELFCQLFAIRHPIVFAIVLALAQDCLDVFRFVGKDIVSIQLGHQRIDRLLPHRAIKHHLRPRPVFFPKRLP